MQHKKTGVVEPVAPELDGKYPTLLTVRNGDKPQNTSRYENANIVNRTSERELWHRRLGHIADNTMRRSLNLCNVIPFKHWDK